MAEVVLDANVLVGLLDAGDVHHARARSLVDRLQADGHSTVLLDVLVGEAVSVLCRRRDRRTQPPQLEPALGFVRQWFQAGDVAGVQGEATRLAEDILDVVLATQGTLNFNDALLVVLRREGVIDSVASFDQGFDQVEGFGRIE